MAVPPLQLLCFQIPLEQVNGLTKHQLQQDTKTQCFSKSPKREGCRYCFLFFWSLCQAPIITVGRTRTMLTRCYKSFSFSHFESSLQDMFEKKKLKIIKSCVKMCHFYCFMFNFCLLPGDTGPLGGAGLHRQHPRRGAVQSPSAIFWQPAASSTVVATGRKGPEQTSVAWWRPWSGHHQTHQLAYNLPASYRHHRGRPWQVQTTNRPAYRLTWLQPEVSCAFSFLAIVFHQDNLLCCFTLFWLRMILNLWLFCWIPYIIWSSTSLFSLMAVLVAICWGISPSSPYYYFTSMAINTLHISCFLSATVLERIAASVKVCSSGF